MAKHALVIGAETLTRFLDYTDRNTCILFGDGAGAVVLSASDEPGGGHGIELTTEPAGAYMIWLPGGGAKSPPSPGTIARGEHYIRMEGKETYRFATRTLASTALAAVEKAGLTAADIDLFIPHQANIRIIEAVAKGLDLPMERMFVNLDKLREHVGGVRPDRARRGGRQGRVKVGDHIVHRRVRRGLHVRRGRHRVDRRPGPRRSPATQRSAPRTSTSGRRSTGTRSTRSRRRSPRSWRPARSPGRRARPRRCRPGRARQPAASHGGAAR